MGTLYYACNDSISLKSSQNKDFCFLKFLLANICGLQKHSGVTQRFNLECECDKYTQIMVQSRGSIRKKEFVGSSIG
jgi:hypothetical protein